jgi:transposase
MEAEMEDKRKRPNKRRIQIRLSRRDRKVLKDLTHRGRESVRVLKRAQLLLVMEEGVSAEQAARRIGTDPTVACQVGKRYRDHGLDKAIREPSRPGHRRVISPRKAQEIVAMVCSPAPEGHARWTIPLIREELQKRNAIEKVPARMTIWRLLDQHDGKPWREKNVVYRQTHA